MAFLDDDAPFSHGPYVLGALMGCPVYLMFCLREGDGHIVYFEHFADRIELPRRNRAEFLTEMAARYAQRLEYHCLRFPIQFYNFFDFWAHPQELLPQPRRRHLKASRLDRYRPPKRTTVPLSITPTLRPPTSQTYWVSLTVGTSW